ncbi:hypothetical protein EDD17DRAFT_1095364 [Pisolithus thermaeus]|nr:hypothetical protein EDD17DRAFT_1095364 [Pisolithus thermaeus]
MSFPTQMTTSASEDTPTLMTSHSMLSAMLTSFSDVALTALLLFLLALTVLGLVLYKALRQQKVGGDEAPEAQYDPEAQTPTRNQTLVPAPPGVGWMPQIRSISCSTPVKGVDKKHPTRAAKRARSPPPASVSRSSDPFADSTPKSVSPRELTLDEEDLPHSNESCSPSSSLLIPRALAVSGLESRGLTRHAQARCS